MIALLVLLSSAAAYSIAGTLTAPRPTKERYQPQLQLQGVKLVLDGKVVTYPSDHGQFVFQGVEEGMHFLEVWDMMYSYPIVLVEVTASGTSAYDATPSALRHEKLTYPLKLTAAGPVSFYERREPFSISSILFNPMVLILGVTVFFTMFSPNSMLDPEQMKEMKEMQKKMSKDMSSNWLSSLMSPPS